MSDEDQTPQVQAHRAITARLRALTIFLIDFVPAVGRRSEQYGPAEDEALSRPVAEARDAALVAAFAAVRRIAETSGPRTPRP